MKYLPLYLSLHNRKVLVVGNGRETAWKVEQLIQAGAAVELIAPELLDELRAYLQPGKLTIKKRDFIESDLEDVWLVVGTAEDRALDERIAKAAEKRRIFYNIVDVKHLCAFIYPAIVTRSDVQIAISTSGNSPALAQRLKKVIGEEVGPEYAKLNDLLGNVRNRVLAEIPNRSQRAEVFQELVNSELLELFRIGKPGRAERKAQELIDSAVGKKVSDRNSRI